MVVSSVKVDYSEDAQRHGIEGRVVLQIIVDRTGRVEHDIKIVESIPMPDETAIDAVRKWSFSPGRNRDGTPVRVRLEVPLRCTLRAGD